MPIPAHYLPFTNPFRNLVATRMQIIRAIGTQPGSAKLPGCIATSLLLLFHMHLRPFQPGGLYITQNKD